MIYKANKITNNSNIEKGNQEKRNEVAYCIHLEMLLDHPSEMSLLLLRIRSKIKIAMIVENVISKA